jgi:zinc protease
VVPKGQEKMIVAENNHTIDTTKYVAPDYGYDGLKYLKAKDKFDRSKMPGNGANPTINVPAYWTSKMNNGVSVIGTKNAELPTVTLSIKMPGGHLLQGNQIEKAGLASFFATMMNEDTKIRSSEEMSRELQKLGSSVSVSSGKDGINFQMQTLKKNLDATIALFEERMLLPKFNDDDFKRIQRQTIENFKQTLSQPSAIADMVFAKLNYGNSILGVSERGDEATVKAMNVEDIQTYYDNFITSEGMNVVVVGDISQEEILPKLAFLNKLPKKKIEIPLINSTLFIHCFENELAKLYDIQGFHSFLYYLKKPAIVRDYEINNLRILLKQQTDYEASELENITKGDKVEVIRGPFQGLIATSIEIDRTHKLIVEIEGIEQKFIVHVPRSFVKKIRT